MNKNLNSTMSSDQQRSEGAPQDISKLSSLHKQDHLKETYKKIVLVSHRNQLPAINVDPEMLIISTDWLTWQYCIEAGHHSIHFESMLEVWPEDRGDPDFHRQNSSTWMYKNNVDISLFHGVSLGKQFNKQLSWLRHGYLQLWHALDRACKRFKPAVLVYHGVRVDFDCLDEYAKLALVSNISEKNGLQLITAENQETSDSPVFHDLPFQVQIEESRNLKYYLRYLYEIVVDQCFKIRFAFVKPSKRVYLLLNWTALENLLKNLQDDKVNPVILARQFPKTISFVLDCWRKNVLLAKLPLARLSSEDENRLAEIEGSIESSFGEPLSTLDLVQQSYIKENILRPGLLRRAAEEVISYEKLFIHHKIEHLVVGDSENRTCRMLLELAHKNGIQADELLNGMFLTDEYVDTRSGDISHPPFITRLLTWGLQNELWLAERNNSISTIRTGYPALNTIREMSPNSASAQKKALVLPMSIEGIKALNTNIFSTLVDTVKGLKNLDFTSIRVKVHVGHPVKKYYEDIAAHFSLDCEIYQEGGLANHIEWADIVIGPIDSGAFVETMSMGKPYYPMRLHPSSLNKKYFGPVDPSESVTELLAAIREQKFPNQQEFLEHFCSSDTIPNASKRVWEVLKKSIRNRNTFPEP
jgi:hypothetical protein